MAAEQCEHPTTYTYKPLLSDRHIRLLHIDRGANDSISYSLVQHELVADQEKLPFEAISYTWGAPDRVSSLEIKSEITGTIGLTTNLTEALPYLCQLSKTRYIWIDQICINQVDNDEKAIQITLMSEVYKKASRVLIWLGPEDDDICMSRKWLDEVNKLIPTLPAAEKITPGSTTYFADTRKLFLRSTWNEPETDPAFAPAVQAFWSRPWFTRGWIVQEFLLAREIVILAGSHSFTLQDIIDLSSVPGKEDSDWMSHLVLMSVKQYPFTEPAPLNYLRTMYSIAGEFDTSQVVDRLFGCLGLMDGIDFTPDYSVSTKQNFTNFAVTFARQYGSLDFLSLWAANLDALVGNTPEEVLGLPSWVPSWTALPLYTPWRLATGGASHYRHKVSWNASAGRKHVHDQEENAVATGRLHVRGCIIDNVEFIAPTKFNRYWDVDKEYIASLADDLKTFLPGIEDWTHMELIHFLNIVAANGEEPEYSAQEVFSEEKNPFREMSGYTERLRVRLSMGRGRRFVKTSEGRLGLVPAIGSKARSEESPGSAIAIVDGCSVPIVLEAIDEATGVWALIGDCYVEGVMHGEIAAQRTSDQTFILV